MNKRKIKALVIDVDGTLTDGVVYMGNSGELCKGFYVRDGLGILMLEAAGIVPIIFTSRESEIVKQRCLELNIKYILQGVKDKEKKFMQLVDELGIKPDETAYIADDINDLGAMKLAGLKGCPADAVPQIKEICDFKSAFNGGKGAVREFIEYILKK